MDRKIKSEKDLKDSKYFCILPWLHAHILPDSTVLPCCVSDFSKPYGKTNEKPLKEIWNDGPFKQMRTQMLQDRPVKSCHNCYELEAGQMESMRQRMNRIFSHHAGLLEKTQDEGSFPDIKMRYLDIRFSNLCNFKCRGCSPFCSSQWFDDYQNLWGTNINSDKLVSLNSTSPANIKELDKNLETLEIAYFAGGEPLMMDEHYYCLEKLIELKKDIPLHYNSNLSVLKFKKYDLIELWKNFSKIDLNISLDDFGKRGEYFRHGLSWDKFQNNVEKIKNELPHARFQVTCTISLFNIHRIPEIHQKMMELQLIDENGFTLNPLQEPLYYRTQVLPTLDKANVTSKLANYKKQLPKLYPERDWHNFQNSIDGILNVMNKASLESELINFKNITQKLDTLRDESFKDTYPELAHLLETKMLIYVPLKNQENRIQPLMRKLESFIIPASQQIFFIDEASTDKSMHVLNLELPQLEIEYKLVRLTDNETRAQSFKIVSDYAIENDFDFVMTVEEGWEDCIDEFQDIVKKREYFNSDLFIGRRKSTRSNLGAFIEGFTNHLTSLFCGKRILETKGDGVNILRVNCLKDCSVPTQSPNFFYSLLLDFLRKNHKVDFTRTDNGLNHKTLISLNTARLAFVLKEILNYSLKKVF